MQELTFQELQHVGGGNPIALLGLGLAVISAAGYLRDFSDGFFDGFGRLNQRD